MVIRRQAIILDRDGVINELVDHSGKMTAPWSFDEFKLMPDVPEAIDLIKKMGYTIIVLTNQPDVMSDKLPYSELLKMDKVLRELGIEFVDNVFVRDSYDYKPNTGALDYWKYVYDLEYFIGDTWKDIVCAHNAGVTSIYCSEKTYNYLFPVEYHKIEPDIETNNLLSAAKLIERINNDKTIL